MKKENKQRINVVVKTFWFVLIYVFLFGKLVNSAMLTYSFDDGHISVYEVAFPILNKYRQVGTANIISNCVVTGWPTKMNVVQLLEMQNAGWEICSHSKTHCHFSKIPQTYNDDVLSGWTKTIGTAYTYQTNYTYDELPFVLQDGNILEQKNSIEEVDTTPGSYYFDSVNSLVYVHTTNGSSPVDHEMRCDSVQRELEMSKIELTNMGLNVQNFIVPFNDWNEERRDMARKYYNSVGDGYHNGYFNNIPLEDPYWLARRPIYTTTTVEEVKSWIEEAISEDKWLILMFHCIGEPPQDSPWPSGYWSEENLKALVEWVSTQDILVVTQQEGIELAGSILPDIKINGCDGPITLNQLDTITITVTLDNNGRTDNADWWLAADTPFGLYFFTFEGWTTDWVPGYQGPLFYLAPFEVLNMPVSGLPAGTYTLYFGIDTVMDGVVTWESTYYDSLIIEITE